MVLTFCAMDVQELMEVAFARRLVLTGEAKQLCRTANLSQGQIARTVGVQPATVSRWEAQTRLPTGAAAVKYARLLRRLRRVSA